MVSLSKYVFFILVIFFCNSIVLNYNIITYNHTHGYGLYQCAYIVYSGISPVAK